MKATGRMMSSTDKGSTPMHQATGTRANGTLTRKKARAPFGGLQVATRTRACGKTTSLMEKAPS